MPEPEQPLPPEEPDRPERRDGGDSPPEEGEIGESASGDPHSDAAGGGGGTAGGALTPGAVADDLGAILGRWPFEPGRTNVRLVRMASGEPAIQVRLELGILQLACTGRPDGRRPHGANSLLEWHLARLEAHRQRSGTDDGFKLSAQECDALRDEGTQVYHRYVALFALDEYEGVVRDTRRNLRMFDLCRDHGTNQGDRTVLEQYRPFVVMMRARAEAAIALKGGRPKLALMAVDSALEELRSHFEEIGSMGAYERSNEVTLLRGMRDALVPRLPPSQRSELEERLRRAIEAENYKLAAILRDELRQLPE